MVFFCAYITAWSFLTRPPYAQRTQESKAIAAWPWVPSRLVKLSLAATHYSSSRGGHTEYSLWCEYSYQVAGKNYSGNRLSMQHRLITLDFFDNIKEWAAAIAPDLKIDKPFESGPVLNYAPDKPVKVYYNPQQPASSVLYNKDAPSLSWLGEIVFPVAFWICLVLFAIRLSAWALKRPEAKAPDPTQAMISE